LSLFVDTSVFFAAFSKNDALHADAVSLLEWALQGEGGTIYTSDYVFDETVTLVRVRTHNSEMALKIGQMVKDSSRVIMLRVDEDIFEKAWDVFREYCCRGLSFTDCTSVALVREHRIGRVLSFDAHFEGIVE
jgi:predicted nucleic acid-binding protein